MGIFWGIQGPKGPSTPLLEFRRSNHSNCSICDLEAPLLGTAKRLWKLGFRDVAVSLHGGTPV